MRKGLSSEQAANETLRKETMDKIQAQKSLEKPDQEYIQLLQKRLESIPELSPILDCKNQKKALNVLTDTRKWAHNKLKEVKEELRKAQDAEKEAKLAREAQEERLQQVERDTNITLTRAQTAFDKASKSTE